jgi:protein arginine kinase activator
MKMCDECGSFPAEIHLTRIVGEKTESLFLCQACAQRRGINAEGEERNTENVSSEPAEKRECAGCGTTLSGFRESGLLGCSECYDMFEQEITRQLRQMRGSAEYRGIKDRLTPDDADGKVGAAGLRHALDEAVKNEDFERAAALRDEIRVLGGKKGKDG